MAVRARVCLLAAVGPLLFAHACADDDKAAGTSRGNGGAGGTAGAVSSGGNGGAGPSDASSGGIGGSAATGGSGATGGSAGSSGGIGGSPVADAADDAEDKPRDSGPCADVCNCAAGDFQCAMRCAGCGSSSQDK